MEINLRWYKEVESFIFNSKIINIKFVWDSREKDRIEFIESKDIKSNGGALYN